MKLELDVDSVVVDEIIANGLKNAYETLVWGDFIIPVFSTDPEQEAREMKKIKKAFERVYKYFTGEKLK